MKNVSLRKTTRTRRITYLHDAPEQIIIRCPKCSECATFDEPFLFCKFYTEAATSDEILTLKMLPDGRFESGEIAPDLQGHPQHPWNGWIVVEKYPRFFHWKLPANGVYDTYNYGLVKCRECCFVGKHKLDWPEDACYRWNIRGTLLWAWSREHAWQLLKFIGGVDRNPQKAAGWMIQMQQLPKQVLTAKVRPLVVKAISQTLAKNSC